MFDIIVWFTLIVMTTALAVFVAARAWEYYPARIFLFVGVSLLVLRLFAEIRFTASNAADAYLPSLFSTLTLVVFEVALLWLFVALFMPSWLQGNRPFLLILLPYGFCFVAIVLDQLLQTGFIFDGIRPTNAGYGLQPARPGGTIFLVLFAGSWLVHLAILIVAFIRQPSMRVSLSLLVGAMIISSVVGSITIINNFQAIPITIALGYVVFRTHLLLPVRAGLDLAVRAMNEIIVVLDTDRHVSFANPAAQALGITPGLPLDPIVPLNAEASNGEVAARQITLCGQRMQVMQNPIRDITGRLIGTLFLGRDITELEQNALQLADERTRLSEMLGHLQTEKSAREELAKTVQALSLPVIPVLPGILVLPLVGDFNGVRINDFIEVLLHSIEHRSVRLVMLDITGLPLLDTEGGMGLLRGIQAANLLGTRCVLIGVRPEIAETLVTLGLPFGAISTAATLQQALQRELKMPSYN